MRSFTVCSAVAMLSASAVAQNGSINIVIEQPTFDWSTQTSMTLSVYGDADFGTHIGGGAFAIQATGGEDTITDMVGSAADWAGLGEDDFGYSGNGDYNGLVFGQIIHLPFIQPDQDSALGNGPVLLGTVEVTFATGYFGSAHFAVVDPETDFVMEVFDGLNDDGDNLPGTYTRLGASDIDFGSAGVYVLPSPSAFGMLGLGGLIASRRRR